MTELTRRQMRELERAGQLSVEDAAPNAAPTSSTLPSPAVLPVQEVIEPSAGTNFDSSRPMSRRELRLMEAATNTETSATQSMGRASALSKSLAMESVEAEPEVIEAPKIEPVRRLGQPLPPVGSSRRERRANPAPVSQISPELAPVDLEDVEIPDQGPLAASYLGEPSTQSIVLDVAPEAISLPVDTGEIFTTGSIAILPDTNGSTTGSLDGIELDQEEAVTGVISVVDPVSARELIDERSPLGVVPSSVLRKGWWKPWAVGALSIVMALAAILASITIFEAIGG